VFNNTKRAVSRHSRKYADSNKGSESARHRFAARMTRSAKIAAAGKIRGLSMLALVSSELADRDRRSSTPLDRGPHWPQAGRAAKCLQPIALRSNDRDAPAEDKFEGLRQRQVLYERSRKAQAELAYGASRLEMSAMSIAHEVNQPLCAIVTNAETCLRRLDQAAPDLELIRELARRVIADARRASEIVVRVSDMAKGKAPRYMPLPFNAVIEEAIACLRHELQSRDITVALDLTHLPPIEGDRIQLQQVVVNLLVNAAQAMAATTAGGRILIQTVLSSPGTVLCSIEDDGPGIEPAHLPHIFDHFFTTKQGGMGIGLQISKSIVEAHGGRIEADNNSALGGARFTFSLPGMAGD
jgi:signal transduction histidine kinase